MIPLSTPPGAEIVCVDDTPTSNENIYKNKKLLSAGSIYTLRDWVPNFVNGQILDGLNVRIHEIDLGYLTPEIPYGFNPARFRLIEKAPTPSFYNVHSPINLETVS